jgi:multiple sugar transport system ATP-binding protein
MATRIVLLKDGVCQQIGRPLELYSRPVNTFTAGFIGTPPMNLLPARILKQEGRLMVAAACFRLPIPQNLSPAYEKLKDGEVIFGHRPEHLRGVREDALPAGDAPAAHLEVDLVEMLGSHVQLTLKCGADRLIALADPALPVKAGDRLPVAFDMNEMHLFAKEAPHLRIGANADSPMKPQPQDCRRC